MTVLTDPIIEPLTVQDVMRITRRSDETVRRWIREGKLESYRIGRRILIPREAVQKLLNRPAGDLAR
jgi:excisionase family DNA binding protein